MASVATVAMSTPARVPMTALTTVVPVVATFDRRTERRQYHPSVLDH
jgi:hypothetical protein